jgi:serine/threonine protein kinase
VAGYEIAAEIARGGMGVIYQARDLAMNRTVAVKVLQDRYDIDSVTAARFIEEAQITGQLQHPGIPPIYHVGRMADGRPFLAMKLIKGQTLNALIKSDETYNKLAVIEAIAQAVGYAHAHGVIHRDLKPQNVMVGAFGEVQVMDWGLAKLLKSPPSGRRQPAVEPPATPPVSTLFNPRADSPGSDTRVGSILGTPAYMPPEQAKGELDQIDQRSDVFGLGAILCQMLTGRPPYDVPDAWVAMAHATLGLTADAFARLDACGAEPEVVALCKRCLAFAPEDRPADGNAVAAEVARLRAEAEERAKQAELAQARAEVQAEEQRKRRRLLQLAGGSILLTLLVGLGLSLWQMNRAIDAEGQAKANEQLALANAEKERLA